MSLNLSLERSSDSSHRAAMLSGPLLDPLLVLSSFPNAFFVVGKNYQVLFANEKAKKFLNLPDHTNRNLMLLNFVPDRRRKKVKAYIDRAFAGKGSSYETQAEEIDDKLWLKLSYIPAMDAEGAVQQVSITIKNITERKRIELYKQELAHLVEKQFESRLLFERFMENAPCVAWITDGQGVMCYMNLLYRRTYCFSQADIGKSIFEMFSAPIAEQYHHNNLRVIGERRAVETVEKAQLEDGSEQILRIFKFPLYTNQKILVGGWAVDVTEQLTLQHELHGSLERYRYVNEATSDAIYDWDLKSRKVHRGEGFHTQFGFSQREGSLKLRLSNIHPGDLTHYKAAVFSALRDPGATSWKTEYRMLDAWGKYHHVVDKAFIKREDTRAVRVIGALQDLTEQKALQEKLVEQQTKSKREIVRSIIETQEMERRQLSVALHENINQLLISSKLMLEMAAVSEQAAPQLIQKSHHSLQQVIREINTLCQGLNPSTLEDLGLVEALKGLRDEINAAGRVQVSFCCAGGEAAAQLSSSDKIAIYRIVQEQLSLIEMQAGGTKAGIDILFQLPEVSIRIKDDGAGIAQEDHEAGLYWKNTATRVDYYGGTLTYQTSPGNGGTLLVTLNLSA